MKKSYGEEDKETKLPNKESVERLVKKINLQYNETLKKLAESEQEDANNET